MFKIVVNYSYFRLVEIHQLIWFQMLSFEIFIWYQILEKKLKRKYLCLILQKPAKINIPNQIVIIFYILATKVFFLVLLSFSTN